MLTFDSSGIAWCFRHEEPCLRQPWEGHLFHGNGIALCVVRAQTPAVRGEGAQLWDRTGLHSVSCSPGCLAGMTISCCYLACLQVNKQALPCPVVLIADCFRPYRLQVTETGLPGPVVVIADCPSTQHLPSLCSAPAWSRWQSSAQDAGSAGQHARVACIVHLAQPEVSIRVTRWVAAAQQRVLDLYRLVGATKGSIRGVWWVATAQQTWWVDTDLAALSLHMLCMRSPAKPPSLQGNALDAAGDWQLRVSDLAGLLWPGGAEHHGSSITRPRQLPYDIISHASGELEQCLASTCAQRVCHLLALPSQALSESHFRWACGA